MFRGFFLIFFVLLMGPTVALADFPLCVQTFNVYGTIYAPSPKRRARLLGEKIAADPSHCNVIQLQEVWTSRLFEILADATERAAYEALFPQRSTEGDDEGKKLGLAGLYAGRSRRPEQEEVYLYAVNSDGGILDDARKIARVAKGIHLLSLTLDDQETVTLVNTHTHPTDRDIRLAQMVEFVLFVWQATEKKPYQPLFVTGDFNATPNSLAMLFLHSALLLRDSFLEANLSYKKSDCTLCTENPQGWHRSNRMVDYILFRSGDRIAASATSSRVNWKKTDGIYLSDHFGVRSHFLLKPSAPSWVEQGERRARIKAALATLEKVKSQLITSKKDYLLNTMERISEIKETLEAALIDSDLLPYFSH